MNFFSFECTISRRISYGSYESLKRDILLYVLCMYTCEREKIGFIWRLMKHFQPQNASSILKFHVKIIRSMSYGGCVWVRVWVLVSPYSYLSTVIHTTPPPDPQNLCSNFVKSKFFWPWTFDHDTHKQRKINNETNKQTNQEIHSETIFFIWLALK